MDQGLVPSSFTEEERSKFERRLRAETRILQSWFEAGRLESFNTPTFGLEIEGWLLDRISYHPKPLDSKFLRLLDRPDVSFELGQYNFEINSVPEAVRGTCFSAALDRLDAIIEECRACADAFDAVPLFVGTLPNMPLDAMTPDNMSNQSRYRDLDRELAAIRNQEPVRLSIKGDEDVFELEHQHIMSESALTSIQVHLKVTPEKAARVFNASLIASAATVATAANASYLSGKRLWADSRIPVFEQSVSVQNHRPAEDRGVDRITFGSAYLETSMFELFQENVDTFPVLLPALTDDAMYSPEELDHLKLHNSLIWRWTRPIIDCSVKDAPHLRVEHRVMSAGPTAADMMANAVFYIGLVHALSHLRPTPPETELTFDMARTNFYQAARFGLDATVTWFDGPHALRTLIFEELIPQARDGLYDLGVEDEDIKRFLDGIILPRIELGQNGAEWQRRGAEHYRDTTKMVEMYYRNQLRGTPVHQWTL